MNIILLVSEGRNKLFLPSDANNFPTVFAIPKVALMKDMACRVFMNTMLFSTERDRDFHHPDLKKRLSGKQSRGHKKARRR
jgi:hypothetical protein